MTQTKREGEHDPKREPTKAKPAMKQAIENKDWAIHFSFVYQSSEGRSALTLKDWASGSQISISRKIWTEGLPLFYQSVTCLSLSHERFSLSLPAAFSHGYRQLLRRWKFKHFHSYHSIFLSSKPSMQPSFFLFKMTFLSTIRKKNFQLPSFKKVGLWILNLTSSWYDK